MAVSVEEMQHALRVLEQLVGDRALLLELSQAEQERLLKAAGLVAHPGRAARRQIVRAVRQQRQQEKARLRDADEQQLERTGIRQTHSTPRLESSRRRSAAPPAPTGSVLPPPAEIREERFVAELEIARNCYICKRDFHKLHFFYDSLCPDCAEFNFQKREQTTDLSGRYALLTGGRVKIGFEAALKLLRCGANLIVTSRFPRDATERFAAQPDSAAWLDRLQVYGLDLRHTRSVEALAAHLEHTLPRLDFILNNACQTVRRPTGFYRHLMDAERESWEELPDACRGQLDGYATFLAKQAELVNSQSLVQPAEKTVAQVAGAMAAELSQIALLPEDRNLGSEFFPSGRYDVDQQQIDLRGVNSWRLKLADVSTVEMLEVQLVNAVAPFLLNARLKPLMNRTPNRDKHIVNVSAMEGVFYRAFKRDTHPHTNMAKAALNMMTRTSALDYIQDGIHMNSVDTGWITDEDPIEITQRKQAERGFRTPLDTIDAAARICNPIIDGLASGEHLWGKFLKDYQVSNW